MGGPNPTYTQPITADSIDYKPLALLAVAGFVFSAVYGVIVVITALVALVKGEPFYLPGWMVSLPIAGAALSGAALWQIHNSEGTRAGTKLAKWGLWVSVVLGLCYLTFHTFTGLAIVSQANRFMLEKDADSGFFPRVQGSDVDLNTAFLFTVNWNERGNARADSEKDMLLRHDQAPPQSSKGKLTQFKESPLVRLIRHSAPGTTKFEALGVKNWTYENRAYKVERKYRITTEEGVYEVPFLITSVEAEAEGEKRKWKAEWAMAQPLQLVTRTPLGQKRSGLRQRSFEFVKNGWFANLQNKRGLDFFLATQHPTERDRLRLQVKEILDGTLLVAAVGPAAQVPTAATADTLIRHFVTNYRGLNDAAKFFPTDNLRFPIRPDLLQKVKDEIAKVLETKTLSLLVINSQLDEYALCEIKNGQLQVTHDFDINVYLNEPAPLGRVGVLVVGKVVVVAPENIDPNAPDIDQQWRVLGAEFTRVLPIMAKQ